MRCQTARYIYKDSCNQGKYMSAYNHACPPATAALRRHASMYPRGREEGRAGGCSSAKFDGVL